MKDEKPSYQTLEARLAQAEEMIAALRGGQVDAILGEDSIYMVRLKEAEEASKRNWALFQNTFENAAVGIAHISMDGRLVRVNKTLCEIVGYDKAELQKMTFQEITHPEDLKKDLALMEQLIHGEIDHYTLEKRYIRKDGEIVWIRLTASMQSEELGIGIIEDISQRKESERALHKAHEEFRALVEASSEVLYRMSPDWLTMRQLHSRGFLTDTEEPNQDWLEEYIPSEEQERVLEAINRAIRNQEPFELEHRVFSEDGTVGWTFSRAVPLVEDGKITEWFGSAKDITQSKQAEKELRKAYEELEHRVQERTSELAAESEQRRYLAKRLVDVLEEDRRNLSMMLHDDVGQIIAGSKMLIEVLRNDLAGIAPEVPAKIDPILESLQGIMAFLRSRSRELRPNSLDTLGLAAALRSIGTGDSKCRIRYHIPEEPEGVHPDLKLAIFRIAQEAVINALKHSECNRIFLSLTSRDHTLNMMIEDNGKGFSWDQMASNEKGQGPMGLLIMRERVVNAGGQFRVESAPGKGTTVIAEFPLGGNPDTTEG